MEMLPELAGELYEEGDDHGYNEWLIELNGICIRFLDVELESFPLFRHHTYDCYCSGASPEGYFTDMILPEIRSEAGIDFIDRIIAQMCKYGVELGRRL